MIQLHPFTDIPPAWFEYLAPCEGGGRKLGRATCEPAPEKGGLGVRMQPCLSSLLLPSVFLQVKEHTLRDHRSSEPSFLASGLYSQRWDCLWSDWCSFFPDSCPRGHRAVSRGWIGMANHRRISHGRLPHLPPAPARHSPGLAQKHPRAGPCSLRVSQAHFTCDNAKYGLLGFHSLRCQV